MTVVLALYPNVRGLGYACVELPKTLRASGIVAARPIRNDQLLIRVEKFLDMFKPNLVITRDSDVLTKRGKRIKKLIEEVSKMAVEKNLPIHYYSRVQIQDAFAFHGATTKHEIAQKIAEWIEELKDKTPKIRKAWQVEDYYMPVFDALALSFTHLYLTD